MTTFDKILNTVGLAMSGVAAAAEGGMPLPGWVKLICAIVGPALLAASPSIVKRNSLKTPKPDARGQVRDAEDPK